MKHLSRCKRCLFKEICSSWFRYQRNGFTDNSNCSDPIFLATVRGTWSNFRQTLSPTSGLIEFAFRFVWYYSTTAIEWQQQINLVLNNFTMDASVCILVIIVHFYCSVKYSHELGYVSSSLGQWYSVSDIFYCSVMIYFVMVQSLYYGSGFHTVMTDQFNRIFDVLCIFGNNENFDF